MHVLDDGTIECTVAGTGSDIIYVMVDTLAGQTDNLFSYQDPYIESASIPPLLGGLVTLYGYNFGTDSNLASVVVEDRGIQTKKKGKKNIF